MASNRVTSVASSDSVLDISDSSSEITPPAYGAGSAGEPSNDSRRIERLEERVTELEQLLLHLSVELVELRAGLRVVQGSIQTTAASFSSVRAPAVEHLAVTPQVHPVTQQQGRLGTMPPPPDVLDRMSVLLLGQSMLSQSNIKQSAKKQIPGSKEKMKNKVNSIPDIKGKSVQYSTATGSVKGDKANTYVQQRRNKEYPFKKEAVKPIFNKLMKSELQLPEPTRPEQAHQVGHPLYCLYHRYVGHPIDDCWAFKDLVEMMYRKGEIRLSEKYLTAPTTK